MRSASANRLRVLKAAKQVRDALSAAALRELKTVIRQGKAILDAELRTGRRNLAQQFSRGRFGVTRSRHDMAAYYIFTRKKAGVLPFPVVAVTLGERADMYMVTLYNNNKHSRTYYFVPGNFGWKETLWGTRGGKRVKRMSAYSSALDSMLGDALLGLKKDGFFNYTQVPIILHPL